MLNVNIVVSRLERQKASIENIVTRSVETVDSLVKSIAKNIAKRLAKPLKVRFPKMLGGLEYYTQCGIQIEQTKGKGLPINIEIGDMLLLNVINTPVKFVEINDQAVRNFVLTTLNHFQPILNYVTKLLMVEYCAMSVTERQILIVENATPILSVKERNGRR